MMRLGLKVVRDCVGRFLGWGFGFGCWLTLADAGEVKLAAPVMQLAADHKAWLHEMAKSLPEEEARECQCLEVEYFIMRTAMVCGWFLAQTWRGC